jgi:hypothetical protein
MERASDEKGEGTSAREPETLTELLFRMPTRALRKQLEEYRVKYEEIHGPTDLTKRYTSTWPIEQQAWLVQNDLKRYFDGLPSFAKAYLKGKMHMAARDGSLDDMPDNYLRLFVAGQMRLDTESPQR